MGSDLKEMKYRRRIGVPAVDEHGQCSVQRGGGDWGMLKQDPVELLRKLDELRDQITRSCQIIGQPRERRRVNRRVLSLLPEHPEPPSPSCGPGYHHVHHAGRYGHQLPPIPSGPLRPAHGERYGRQPSARCRQYPGRHWENCGFGHGDYHHNMCTCAHCLHGQQAAVREEHIPMARYFAGQHECYRFERSPSVSSDYDQRSVASSLYSHRSVSKRRAEYFRKKAENLCRPVRGAAPFVVCSSCYQLLQVPLGKCTGRKQSRLQCGSCSEMVSFQHEEAKISPYIPSESFPDSKTEQSSNDQMRPDFEHQHHDDVNSVFCNLKEHNSMQINIDFADDNSLSSTTSHDRIDKECGSYRSIQSKVEGPSVSPSRAGDVESPKDILCERDADCQVEPSVDGLISSRSPVLEDKLVDPLCSQEKDDNVVDQRTTNRYDQNCKGEYIANVEDVIISVGSEQMSKEDGKCALEDESMSRRYEEKSKEDDSISLEDGNKKFEQKSTQDDISTLEDGNTKYEWKCKEDDTNSFIDESVNKVDELKSKEDGKNDLEAENIGKKYDESNEEDANSALEGESTSKKHEQRNIEDDNGKLQQSCIEDPNALADTGSSVNECANSGFSRGSSEAGLDEDQSSTGRSGDSSFFAGFLKKGFKDLSLFNQSMDSVKVSINGHPISERALKKAEKKAGPVEPGSYWYDYRVGFWGVMGRECIGIIPPFIREFNYPMARNCAGGNTGVFVNGRELHQRDLDLLVGRGLPRISGKSYSIEISGNVTDETIGKKLRGLGKLAPTIEKLKRGFGMHVPEEFG